MKRRFQYVALKRNKTNFPLPTADTAVAPSSPLISTFPCPFLAQAGRVAAGKVYCSSARLGCRSGTAVAASLPCVNSLPPLPLGQGWVRQPTKWSVSHSSVCPIYSQIPSKRGTSLATLSVEPDTVEPCAAATSTHSSGNLFLHEAYSTLAFSRMEKLLSYFYAFTLTCSEDEAGHTCSRKRPAFPSFCFENHGLEKFSQCGHHIWCIQQNHKTEHQ